MDQPTAAPDLAELLGTKPPSRRRRFVKWVLAAVGVLLLGLLVRALFFAGPVPVSYATEPVRVGALQVGVSATGNLQPTNQVEVGSELSGIVTEVAVDTNDRVVKGQVLARLDVSRLRDAIAQSQAQLQSAQASVVQAQATAAQAGATLRRQQEVFRLSGGKVPSATELDTARAENLRARAAIETARASVAQARAQLSSDTTQLSKASIRSPVTGVVLARSIAPGQTVAASFNVATLFKIAEDLSRMRLEVKVDEADVGQVHSGQPATFQVDAFPGRSFPAVIERVDVAANGGAATTSTTGTTGQVVAYTARLAVANPDLLLRPGMTATAEIVTTRRVNALLVPNAALRYTPTDTGKAKGGLRLFGPPEGPKRVATIGRGSRQTVYVLAGDRPRAVAVTIGDSDGARTEVTGGALRAGQRIVTGELAPGAAPAKAASGG